ncbi:unnamed protein product [Periconia digitata]|uniref:Uncharacterized protein n=1 Tax=Periconia digitata TaxID=1303443 RepID=A0A9W4UB07_9PLEO|nr:unnamed protein product [Periconia digitata]
MSEDSSHDPLGTLFPAAEKITPFQDWPWPEWDAAIGDRILASNKYVAYIAALLGVETLKFVKTGVSKATKGAPDLAKDRVTLAIYHKGAVNCLNNIRSEIPEEEEKWVHLQQCLDDLEMNLHRQFVFHMEDLKAQHRELWAVKIAMQNRMAAAGVNDQRVVEVDDNNEDGREDDGKDNTKNETDQKENGQKENDKKENGKKKNGKKENGKKKKKGGKKN